MVDENIVAALVRRRTEMLNWLENECPDVCEEQRHLDQGSEEQAYWHHGYQAALADVVQSLLASEESPVIPTRLN